MKMKIEDQKAFRPRKVLSELEAGDTFRTVNSGNIQRKEYIRSVFASSYSRDLQIGMNEEGMVPVFDISEGKIRQLSETTEVVATKINASVEVI